MLNRSMLGAVLIGLAVAAAGGAAAEFGLANQPAYAVVLSVEPLTIPTGATRANCPRAIARGHRRASAHAERAIDPRAARAPAEAASRRCVPGEAAPAVIGYEVRYRLGDTVDTVRTKTRPGERIPVRDGRLLVDTLVQSS